MLCRFFLSCAVLFQLKGKYLYFVCAIQLTIHSPSLFSFLFYDIKLFYMFFFLLFKDIDFIGFIIYTTLSHFLFWFSFKINELNKHPIFTHLTRWQILQELLQFKNWHFLKDTPWATITVVYIYWGNKDKDKEKKIYALTFFVF